MCTPLESFSQGRTGLEGFGLGEVQCRVEGFTKHPAHACVCEQRQHQWCMQTVPPPEMRVRVGARSRSAGKFAAHDCRSQAERALCREGSLDYSRAMGH